VESEDESVDECLLDRLETVDDEDEDDEVDFL
jgi:hypothetical protein